ncbi:nucleic-acid-binding protein from transposon X-element [Trichonephila clavipes]|nr:nucleic-acid-binding protein from transposon X-element [Trichonephila clavipes]
MTSIPNWSEMTDSTVQPAATTTGLGASPSQTNLGDDHIAENSDVFREAIKARNIYAAWARKLTNAKPSDPDVQTYHMEVKKAGETVESLLVKLNVPLFKIPTTEKELDKIVFRVKNKQVVSTSPKNHEAEKPAAVPPPPSNSPRKGRKGKRSVDADGFAPPSSLFEKLALPVCPLHLLLPPPSATSVEDARLEGEEEEMDSSQPAELQDQVVVPEVIKKPRIPPFFVSPKGDWRQLVALAKLIAPSFQSQMSGRFLKVTVGDELEYRNLSHWLEQTGVEFKSFMLKQDRPIKVVIRGLPSNTEPEDIKTEIEAEGFKVAKISQMKNYRTKAPMPLFYLQIENGAEALKIYDFTELFGTRIEVKPFERGNEVNQCWRCQGWFHSSEVCHLPPRCVKCAGPHSAKDCTLDFNDPMKCANCSAEKKMFPLKTTPQAPRPDISKARKVSPNLDYSKVVQNLIPREHVSPPSTSTAPPTPAPSKDASGDAGLLKDLLTIIEDTPCIDKQVFCRAFKNSLPALRSASADVDKIVLYFRSLLQASLPPGLIFPVHVKNLLDWILERKFFCVTKSTKSVNLLTSKTLICFWSRKPGLSQGSTAITPIEKAEVIADSLQEQFEPNHVADREVFDQRIHEEVANFLATPHVQEIEPTTPTEVLTYAENQT